METSKLPELLRIVENQINNQISVILNDSKFDELRTAWRSLHFLVANTEISDDFKICVLDIAKSELEADMLGREDISDSKLSIELHAAELTPPFGSPFGVLLSTHPYRVDQELDIQLLAKITAITADTLCPFIAEASSSVLGLKTWMDFIDTEQLNRSQLKLAQPAWDEFRKLDRSRHCVLTVPLTPDYEGEYFTNDEPRLNSALLLGAVISSSFQDLGLPLGIQGEESARHIANFADPRRPHDALSIRAKEHCKATDSPCQNNLLNSGFCPAAINAYGKEFFPFARNCANPISQNTMWQCRLPTVLVADRFAQYAKQIAQLLQRNQFSDDEIKEQIDIWIGKYCNGCAQGHSLNWMQVSKMPLHAGWVDLKRTEVQDTCTIRVLLTPIFEYRDYPSNRTRTIRCEEDLRNYLHAEPFVLRK